MRARLMLIGVGALGAALLLTLLQVALLQRDQARREARQWRAELVLAKRHAAASDEAARAVEAAQGRQLAATLKAKEAADEIEEAHGADASVAPDVLRLWGAAVDGLRHDAANARARADTGGAEPARTLSPALAAGPADRG